MLNELYFQLKVSLNYYPDKSRKAKIKNYHELTTVFFVLTKQSKAMMKMPNQ
jgi:hypothetical protein